MESCSVLHCSGHPVFFCFVFPESYLPEYSLLRLLYLVSLVPRDFWWLYIFHCLEGSLDLKCVGQQCLHVGCSVFKLDPEASVNGELTSDGQCD